MDDCSSSISAFCSQLRRHCGFLESSCNSLRSAADRAPSSLLPSNVHSYLANLRDRVFTTSAEVETLESMTTGTISFEELLGHCMELYKQNETSICTLEDRLKQFGYKPGEVANVSPDDPANSSVANGITDLNFQVAELCRFKPAQNQTIENSIAPLHEARKALSLPSLAGDFQQLGSVGNALAHSNTGTVEDPGQYGSVYDSFSLQDLGLSAAGLACLAQEESSPGVECVPFSMPLDMESSKKTFWTNNSTESPSGGYHSENSEVANGQSDVVLVKPVNEAEYNNSPIWLKIQISLEELNSFLERICDVFSKKANGSPGQTSDSHASILHQEDLPSLGPGAKIKPCLLLLVRLGRLITGHENGAPVYHLVHF